MRRRLGSLLKLAIGLGLVAWLLTQLDFAQVRQLAAVGDPRDLVLGMGAFLLALAGFQALRLHVLVRVHTGSLAVSYQLFFVGALFNHLLPSNVGGDAVRLLYLRNMGAGVAGPAALLLLHRLSGLAVLLVPAALYLLLRPARALSLVSGGRLGVQPTTALWLVLALGVLASLLVLLALRHPRVRGGLATAGSAIRALSARDWVALTILTVLFQGARLIGFVLVARYLGETAAPFDTLFVLAVAAVAALLPISIAGLGVMEGSISFLLSGFGMAPAVAIAVAFAHRLALLSMALVGGLVYGVGARTKAG